MILQALVAHYEDLVRQDKLSRPGWSPAKVSYGLELGENGELKEVVNLKTEQTKGKKTVLAPREMKIPTPVKRTVGIVPNFLCDNSSYLLGVDAKGKPQRSMDCFSASKALHEELLADLTSPMAKAVLGFFRTWDPGAAKEHPALKDCWEDVISGGNLVFCMGLQYAHEDAELQAAWQTHYDSAEDSPQMTCLVTGTKGPVAQLHPAIKGISGAQSSGASLVSFNAPAFCSYDREQGMNAPTGAYAAFAYGAALNHLIADREHVCHMGDTTVLCWSAGAESAYQDLFSYFAFDASSAPYTETELRSMVKDLMAGKRVLFDETMLDPDREFYILGIAPNAARLSVRFFLRNSFGAFLANIEKHHERMEIIRPGYDKFETLPLWKLLDETVNHNSRTKTPAPELAGETLRAILNDTPYPATLLNGVVLRIRAEHEVTRGRAAILKAYYLKKPNKDVPKEVLGVSLNPDSTNVAYTLGRLFSVLENIQSAANPGINTTIKDKYFNSASATPASVFPTLVNLAQKHLKKLDGGMRIYYEKQLTEILSFLSEEYPKRMNLPQQGSFQLGYYHQTQARYQHKGE